MNRRPVARAAAGIGTASALSRALGLARVLVIGAILGTTHLGNAFQGANQFATVLFELLAAGALSAVLVPPFVAALDAGDQERAEDMAGGVLAVAVSVLGAVVIVAVVAAPALARLLTAEVDDPVVAADQAALTTMLLRWFLPQLPLYALGAVATAVLHAQRRFSVPALAPIGNTLVVVAGLAAFAVLAGPDPGLELGSGEVAVLGLTGTGGVVAFVALPVLALARGGFRLQPRWGRPGTETRRLLGLGSWATMQHASGALLLGVAIVVGGRAEGGVVAFQIAWLWCLAPFGVVGQAIQTAVLPALAHDWITGDHAGFARSLRWALGATVAVLGPVSAAFVALAGPLAEVVAFGAARRAGGVALIAAGIAGLGLGVVGYSASHLLARAWYARGVSRRPAVATVLGAVTGAVAMVAVARFVEDPVRLVLGLGLAHSLAYVVSTLALAPGLSGPGERLWTNRWLVPSVAAVVAGALVWGAVELWDPAGRIANLVALVVSGGALAAVAMVAGRVSGLLVGRPGDSAGVPA